LRWLTTLSAAPENDYDNKKDGLQFLDAELEGLGLDKGRGQVSVVNKLVKIKRKDGRFEHWLIHIEELADELLPDRVFQAFIRLLDIVSGPVGLIAIVVDTVARGNSERLDRFYRKSDIGNDTVRLNYPTYRVTDFSDAELLSNENPFALVLLAAKKSLLKGRITHGELLEETEKIAKAILQDNDLTDREREMLFRFLDERMALEFEGIRKEYKGRAIFAE